jgi:hypothetical protein
MKTFLSYPSYRHLLYTPNGKQVEQQELTGQILLIFDIFDHGVLESIFMKFGRPACVVSDSYAYCEEEFGLPFYYANLWLDTELVRFKKQKLKLPELAKTTKCANILVNKHQLNRYLGLKFCEIFNVDMNYTWSGTGRNATLISVVNDLEHIQDQTIDPYIGKILSPINLPTQWHTINYNEENDNSAVINYGNNPDVWNQILFEKMSSTATSLITESMTLQKISPYSEKTLFGLLALTFPIFVGGYSMASTWQKLGFDIFDDIIDHSYENMPTVIERCFYAFYLNKHILTDISYASEKRTQCLDRLLNNRQLILSNQLSKANKAQMQTWPEHIYTKTKSALSQLSTHNTINI